MSLRKIKCQQSSLISIYRRNSFKYLPEKVSLKRSVIYVRPLTLLFCDLSSPPSLKFNISSSPTSLLNNFSNRMLRLSMRITRNWPWESSKRATTSWWCEELAIQILELKSRQKEMTGPLIWSLICLEDRRKSMILVNIKDTNLNRILEWKIQSKGLKHQLKVPFWMMLLSKKKINKLLKLCALT